MVRQGRIGRIVVKRGFTALELSHEDRPANNGHPLGDGVCQSVQNSTYHVMRDTGEQEIRGVRGQVGLCQRCRCPSLF